MAGIGLYQNIERCSGDVPGKELSGDRYPPSVHMPSGKVPENIRWKLFMGLCSISVKGYVHGELLSQLALFLLSCSQALRCVFLAFPYLI